MTTQALARARLTRVPGVAVALILLCVVFAAANPGFASPANIANILTQSTILLMLALPMTLIIMTEGLDLSIGAVLTLASIALAMTAISTGSQALGLLVALGVGACFGLANGVLVAVFDIPPILFAALAYLVTHVLLYRTRFGTYVFALGGNREALKVAGISVRGMLIRVYMFGGLMAGFAALLLTARLNSAHPTAGIGMEFDAIAAIAVGGTSFERGNGWLLGTLLGVMTIGVLRNGLNLMAVPSSTQVACIGALVILALFIDGLRGEV
jgi:ribose transport system permease protein